MKVVEILAAHRRQDCRVDVPATPPGVFARQRSEPVKVDRRPPTGSPLPSAPSFSRLRSCQPASVDELREREVQSLLNKVCPENVASVIEKMSSMEVGTADAMEAVIEIIFKKALAEPHYCETYADIVFGLKSAFPEFQSPVGSEPMTFKSLVINICQHELEELFAAPESSEDERAKLDPEELDDERQERRRRMRANMRFIGHLFLRQLLSAKVIGSMLCELTLVEQPDILPEEHAIECACELLRAIGSTLESLPAGRAALAAVCGRMQALRYATIESGKQKYSKRVQFIIQGCVVCYSDDEPSVDLKRVPEEARTRAPTMSFPSADPWPDSDGDEAACSAQGPPPTARSPGTPKTPRTAWTTPPSTPRGPARVPTTPPPLRRPDLVEPLLLGLEKNCLKQVRLAIEANPEAAKDPIMEPRFEWPLCAAIRLRCNEEIIRLLIENGASVHVTSVGGQSPLQLLSSGTEKIIFSDPLMDMSGVPGIDEWTERMRGSLTQFELGVATALLDSGADPGAIHDDLGRGGDSSSLELARRSGKDHLVGLYETQGRQQ